MIDTAMFIRLVSIPRSAAITGEMSASSARTTRREHTEDDPTQAIVPYEFGFRLTPGSCVDCRHVYWPPRRVDGTVLNGPPARSSNSFQRILPSRSSVARDMSVPARASARPRQSQEHDTIVISRGQRPHHTPAAATEHHEARPMLRSLGLRSASLKDVGQARYSEVSLSR